MKFDLEAPPEAGEVLALRYTPQHASGAVVTALDVSHEERSHLIVVSRDLSFFDHVHPEYGTDGAFEMPYTFPAGGRYVLFADFTPSENQTQTFRHEVEVEGAPSSPAPLGPATREAAVDGLKATLITRAPMRAGEVATLGFRLTDSRGEVRDLQPYLGAGGHVVVISEGTDDFLHVHPVEEGSAHAQHGAHPHAEATYGPELRFATRFPAAGYYKLWLQVQREGRIYTLPFVLDLTAEDTLPVASP